MLPADDGAMRPGLLVAAVAGVLLVAGLAWWARGVVVKLAPVALCGQGMLDK